MHITERRLSQTLGPIAERNAIARCDSIAPNGASHPIISPSCRPQIHKKTFAQLGFTLIENVSLNA